jgi:RHS repeat-associated protein
MGIFWSLRVPTTISAFLRFHRFYGGVHSCHFATCAERGPRSNSRADTRPRRPLAPAASRPVTATRSTTRAPSGAVNTSTSLNCQYTYDTTTSGSIYSNQLRLQTDVHPNGRTIYYDYGSSGSSTAAYNALSKVREIWDGSPSGTGLAVYDYNGAGRRLAMATYPQPSFKLDHFEGTSGTYAALDRFGRIVDQYWAGFGGTADADRTHYAYDYAGRRTYRQIDTTIYPTDNRDQAYTYDGLSRLLTSQVGTLSGTTISGTPASEEDWALDGIGNWPGYIQKTSGTTSLNQGRTASPANEISGISASVGSTWTTPAYDLAGNMTTIPVPAAPTSGYTATYDAWNRLVSLANGTATVATYAYDGRNRRIIKGIYVSGSLDHNEHAYFNEAWQILEVRKEVGGVQSTNPLEQYAWHLFYIDAPVLRDYDAATSGSPTRYYYTFDANYHVTAAATTVGAAAERYYYSPYGSLIFLDGSFNVLTTQQSQIGNSVTFTGRQFDSESGLYYFRRRYFHSQLGQFVRRDPLLYVNGLSLYCAYFAPNSLDPTGTVEPVATTATLLELFGPELVGAAGDVAVLVGPPALMIGAGAVGWKAGEKIDELGYNPITPVAVGAVNGYYWTKETAGSIYGWLVAAATDRVVVQTGGHTLTDATRRALNLTKDRAKRAMERIKKESGQGSSNHGHKIFDNGDVETLEGKLLGNLLDE